MTFLKTTFEHVDTLCSCCFPPIVFCVRAGFGRFFQFLAFRFCFSFLHIAFRFRFSLLHFVFCFRIVLTAFEAGDVSFCVSFRLSPFALILIVFVALLVFVSFVTCYPRVICYNRLFCPLQCVCSPLDFRCSVSEHCRFMHFFGIPGIPRTWAGFCFWYLAVLCSTL